MRQGQHNRRPRNRGRRPQNPANRVFDSNGPSVKIRGSASTIAEKYISLGRDAQATGDRIAAENYLQHAEHYLRIVAATKAQNQPQTSPAPAKTPQPQPVVPQNTAPPAESEPHEDERPSSRNRRTRPVRKKETAENTAAAADREPGEAVNTTNPPPPGAESNGRCDETATAEKVPTEAESKQSGAPRPKSGKKGKITLKAKTAAKSRVTTDTDPTQENDGLAAS